MPAPPQCTHLHITHTSTMHTPAPPHYTHLRLHITHTSAVVTHTYTYSVHPPPTLLLVSFPGHSQILSRSCGENLGVAWECSYPLLCSQLHNAHTHTHTTPHTHNAHTHHTRATFQTARIIVFRWWSLVTMRWTRGTPPPIPLTTPS